MAISSEIFDGELPGLEEALSAALPVLDSQFAEGLLAGATNLIGPFTSYSADPRDFVQQREASPDGWRGLVVNGDAPLALVDVFKGELETPSYGFRGSDAAGAMAAALRIAQRFEDDDRHYTVRWLSLPEIYVTALWLIGPTTLYIPTRLGSSERPTIEPIAEDAFIATVKTLIAEATEMPGPDGDEDSPRSGLSRRG